MPSRSVAAVAAWGVAVGVAGAAPAASQRPGAVATVSAGLPRAGASSHYAGNRPPLKPSAMRSSCFFSQPSALALGIVEWRVGP